MKLKTLSMNFGTFMATTFLSMGMGIMSIIYYRTRKERLVEREKIVNDALQYGLHEKPGPAIGDGFVFCSLWRLSDIVRIGQECGYVLTQADCYSIIGSLKKNHNKEQGINIWVIRNAIDLYVGGRTMGEDIEFQKVLGI